MIQLALAIRIRVIYPVINRPKLLGSGIHINTGHNANSFNHLVLVPAKLLVDAFYLE